jgi:hypothetical protein
MTFQGDQQSIVSESGSAEDGLVSVRATSAITHGGLTGGRGLSTARRDLSSRDVATLPERSPRNFGSEMRNAMARGRVSRFLVVLLIFRFSFRDLLFFCDKSALLFKRCFPNRGKVGNADLL